MAYSDKTINLNLLHHHEPYGSTKGKLSNRNQKTNICLQVEGRFWIYIQHVNLRDARRFTCCPSTGVWSPYMRHTALSSLRYLGTTQKVKSHDMIKKLEHLIFSVLHHNIYRFQGVIIPDTLNIKRGDFYCHSHLNLLLFGSEFNSAMHLWNFVVTPITLRYLFLSILEMMVIIFFYISSRIVRWILK